MSKTLRFFLGFILPFIILGSQVVPCYATNVAPNVDPSSIYQYIATNGRIYQVIKILQEASETSNPTAVYNGVTYELSPTPITNTTNISNFPQSSTEVVPVSPSTVETVVKINGQPCQAEIVKTKNNVYEAAMESNGYVPDPRTLPIDPATATVSAYEFAKMFVQNDEDYQLQVKAITDNNALPPQLDWADVNVAFATLEYADVKLSQYINLKTGEVKQAAIQLKDNFYETVKKMKEKLDKNAGKVSLPHPSINGETVDSKDFLSDDFIFSNQSFYNQYAAYGHSYTMIKHQVKLKTCSSTVYGFGTTYGGIFFLSKSPFTYNYRYKQIGYNDKTESIPSYDDVDWANDFVPYSSTLYNGWYYSICNSGMRVGDSRYELVEFACPYPSVPFETPTKATVQAYIDTLPDIEVDPQPYIKVKPANNTYPSPINPYEVPQVKPNFYPDDVQTYVDDVKKVLEDSDPESDTPIEIPYAFPEEVPIPDYSQNPELYPNYDPDSDPFVEPSPSPSPSPSPDPEPSPSPSPSPSPDPEPSPSPSPSPSPDPEPSPSPSPSPSPDPEPSPSPSPSPSPDPSDSESETDLELPTDIGRLTLLDRFPFCVPQDLVNGFKLFAAKPETPVWSWNLKIPQTQTSVKFEINLSKFDKIAELCRALLTISFILGLVKITRIVIKG